MPALGNHQISTISLSSGTNVTYPCESADNVHVQCTAASGLTLTIKGSVDGIDPIPIGHYDENGAPVLPATARAMTAGTSIMVIPCSGYKWIRFDPSAGTGTFKVVGTLI